MFSTFTHEEYKKLLGRKSQVPDGAFVEEELLDTTGLADSVDWRALGGVNPVQDQGQCGSCWAFSSTAALEGAHFVASGKLLKLAEQQFVDCVTSSAGCNGGMEADAFEYAQTNPQELESSYPYTARTGTCKANKSLEVVQVSSYKAVQHKSYSQLKAAVAAQPTCVAVDAESSAWQLYSKGIFNPRGCGTNLDHAITAVGYGSENGVDYFIVRNSWTANWGEQGYVRMAALADGTSGVCGMYLDPVRASS
jgi:C1A family cysteine protease